MFIHFELVFCAGSETSSPVSSFACVSSFPIMLICCIFQSVCQNLRKLNQYIKKKNCLLTFIYLGGAASPLLLQAFPSLMASWGYSAVAWSFGLPTAAAPLAGELGL